jgi:large subunit ribosomal protein L29
MKTRNRTKDLRGTEVTELERTLATLREELFKHKLKHNTNQIENTMVIRSTRRDIARVSTILGEKTRATGQGAGKVG